MILTKEAEFVPFILKRAQHVIHKKLEKQLKETGSVYALILKARQLGASTYIAGRFYHGAVHKPNQKIVVVAHDKDTAVSLFEKTKEFIYNQPDETRPALVGGKPNAQNVKFVETKSSYKVATAGSPEVGRGTTSNKLHLSEAAFYSNDVKTIRGILQGVPKKGAEVIFESTPNGPQGEFFRMWNEAVAGNSRYLPIFLPWFDEPEYRQSPPETWEVPEHDLKYMEKHNLDIEQMYWRHLEIADLNIDGFRQEYPATPEEAFMTSGASVFDLEILDQVITKTAISQEVFDLVKRIWVPKDDGPLQIYRAPHLHEKFVIGADVAQGGMSDRSDYSTAIVFSEENEVIATYRSQRIGPKDFATILASLGHRHNHAMIAAERNSIGVATAEVLKENYDNLYYDDQKTYQDPNHLPGFYTGWASRPKIVASMQSALLHNES